MTPHLAIALLSAGILSYEVLLIRLLAIVQWHHFAYMVISIALLGFGASGTLLTFFGARWRGRFRTAFCVNAVAFGLLAPLAFLLAQRLPFNALEILWEPRQLLYLTALYLLLFVPFLAGANAIGLAFLVMPARIGGVYAVNLIGSGLGSLIAVATLFLLPPERVLLLTGGLGLAAAGTVMLGRGRGLAVGAALLAAAVVLPVAVPGFMVPPAEGWGPVVLIGLLGGVGYLLLIAGLRRIPASVFSLVDYTALLWAAAFGFVFFNEVVEPSLWLGGAMIIAACACGMRARQPRRAAEAAAS